MAEHIKELEGMIGVARVELKIMVEKMSSDSLFLSRISTSIGLVAVCILFFALFLNKRKPQKQRMTASSPRTIYDRIGQLTSDAFALVVLPFFVVFYVIINELIVGGGKMYDGKFLTVGYLLHVSTGSLYFIAGGLQFHTPLRQRFPKFHRKIGYFYYFMVILTSVGLIMLSVKPHSGLPTQIAVLSFLPPWIWCNVLAFRAIAFNRNVELHRQLNIVALAFSSSIIAMRPLTMSIMIVEPTWTFGRSLGLAVWVAFVYAIFGSIFYIIHAYTLPTIRYPRLQLNGDMIISGSAHCPLPDTITGAVFIQSHKVVDSRTIILRLGTPLPNSNKNSQENYREPFPISIQPGCHIVLTLHGIIREYTPVNIQKCEIEMIIRLVPNGKFSSILLSSLGLESVGIVSSVRNKWIPCCVACGIYGPLYPLPSKFGYLPFYGSLDGEKSRNIIMIGGGSGAMPLLNIIEAALKNKDDKSRILFLSLTNSSQTNQSDIGSDYSSFLDMKIKDLSQLAKVNASDPTQLNRFDGTNFPKRFEMSMIDSWIQDLPKLSSVKPIGAHSNVWDRTVVWICGPPGFGESCRSILLAEKKLHRDQIFVLGADDR